jgi:hypothetical protein
MNSQILKEITSLATELNTEAVYVFDVLTFNVYYEDGCYALVPSVSIIVNNLPSVKKDAFYIFSFNGTIIKDREGNASDIWPQIKNMIDIHQVMSS